MSGTYSSSSSSGRSGTYSSSASSSSCSLYGTFGTEKSPESSLFSSSSILFIRGSKEASAFGWESLIITDSKTSLGFAEYLAVSYAFIICSRQKTAFSVPNFEACPRICSRSKSHASISFAESEDDATIRFLKCCAIHSVTLKASQPLAMILSISVSAFVKL